MLVRAFDQPDIPVACGVDVPLDGHSAAPSTWRHDATTLAGMDLDRSGLTDSIGDAESLLRTTLSGNDDIAILALGPLTNIAPVLSEPEATVTHDGASCAYDGPGPLPADLGLEVVNSSSTPGPGVIFGVYEPGTTLQQAADFAAAGVDRPPPRFELISVAPLPTNTSSIWILRDLPGDVTVLCGVTPSSAREIAGFRLPH